MTRSIKALAVLLSAATLLAWPQLALGETLVAAATQTVPPTDNQASAVHSSYTLGSADKLRVIVFGEEDLSGEFIVDDSGFVRLPLVGQVAAKGRTVDQLEQDVSTKLSARYLKNPRVSIQVVNYRPFYIIGEVNRPGEYPYVAGMNALNAIALAGGYTYRANESVVHIRRKGAVDEESNPADDTTNVGPGDIIRVSERWF